MVNMKTQKGENEEIEKSAIVIVFETTNIALGCEKLLRASKIPCIVIPTPTEVTADCGIALLLRSRWEENARKVLSESNYSGYRILHLKERKILNSEGKRKFS